MKINYIDKYNESRVNSTSIVYETLKRYFEENKLLDNNSSISFGFFKNDLDIIEFTKNNSIDYVQRASFEHNIPTKKHLRY